MLCIDFREYRNRIIGYKKGNKVRRPSAYHNYSLHNRLCKHTLMRSVVGIIHAIHFHISL